MPHYVQTNVLIARLTCVYNFAALKRAKEEGLSGNAAICPDNQVCDLLAEIPGLEL